MEKFAQIESEIIEALKNVFDPELPVNVYDLGLIYEIKISEEYTVEINMTLTAPNCPMVDQLVEDVRSAVNSVSPVKSVSINIVFDPPWTQERLSDEAKLELGLL